MAIGSLFHGTARGRIGETVYYRKRGNQHQRVRLRHVYNPQTNAQLYQRAIVATVMQAYSAGREIFDHSFQHYKFGEGNYRRFLSLNTRLLRNLVSNDLNNAIATNKQAGRVIAPKSLYPVGFNGMYVSEGTYPMKFWVYSDSPKVTGFGCQFPEIVNGETVSDYARRNGLVAGDLYTFVAFVCNPEIPVFEIEGDNQDAFTQYYSKFVYCRLAVKDSALVSTAVIRENEPITTFFDVSKTNLDDTSRLMQSRIGDLIDSDSFVYDWMGVYGLIRSRLDSNVRSTSLLHPRSGITDFGLCSSALLPAWQTIREGGDLISSDMILEGGDGNP